MILWLNSEESPPKFSGYTWARTVADAKKCVVGNEELMKSAENLLGKYHAKNKFQLAHSLETALHGTALSLIEVGNGFHNQSGEGDYANFLSWLEETHRNYEVRIRATDAEERCAMRRIIKRNGWKEVCLL